MDGNKRGDSFDRHMHFSGSLPEHFLRSVLLRVRNPNKMHNILSAALSAPRSVPLFERIRAASGLGASTVNYETFFSVYSVVNGACLEARTSDSTFFARAAIAICERLEITGVSGCELVVGIMHTLEATLDRIEQLRRGISDQSATGQVFLRLTLIRGANGCICEAQLATCKNLIDSEEFPDLASDVAGFDISGHERTTPIALAQLRTLRKMLERAENRAGQAFHNTIHLGECLTSPEVVPTDFYADILDEAVGWRIIHGLQFWHQPVIYDDPRLREIIEGRPLEFDICPSASQLIHEQKIDFCRLESFCKETGSQYAICTDNPSLLTTHLRREAKLVQC